MAQQKAIFPRDGGLQARMLLTLFLLGLLYVGFVAVLVAAGAGAVTILVVMGALSLGQLFFSDKLALSAMGAKQVTPEEAPGLHAMIERLCIQADLPKPKIAVADTNVPNAFALGRSQKSATVCATTGHHAHALTKRARGRDGARARPREAPRRPDHDHRELLRRASPR